MKKALRSFEKAGEFFQFCEEVYGIWGFLQDPGKKSLQNGRICGILP